MDQETGSAALAEWSWNVDMSASGLRADRAIVQALEAGQGSWKTGEPRSLSRSQLQKLMSEGKVTLDGIPIEARTKVSAGALIKLSISAPKSLNLTPEDLPLDVLFQDEHLIVVNKPPGLTVHPSPTQTEGTLVHALLHHVKDLSGIGGTLRPGIVHRIDKDTSGVLVVTKTDAAHAELARVFARHEIERRYWALCYGSLEKARARPLRIETLIGRNPADRKKMSPDVSEGAGGRRAVTHVKLVEAYGEPGKNPFACWVEASLETGRTHQVRVHLTHLGHSLLGDPVYGVPTSRNPKWIALPSDVRAGVEAMPGQALHARVLAFKHPVTGEALHFEATPPPEFDALHQLLRRYL